MKLLYTYQLGDKKSDFYTPTIIKLEKLAGDGEEFCKNFIFPKEKNKKRFQFFPILRNILFRLIKKKVIIFQLTFKKLFMKIY